MADREFRWQSLFQRSRDPVFLLSSRRQLLFVNKAWEELTGRTLREVRGLACRRHKEPGPGSLEELANFLLVPPEVVAGQTSRVRRVFPGTDRGKRWCDLDFVPLREGEALAGILGRITVIPPPPAAQFAPLPPELIALREERLQRFRFDFLAGTLAAGSPALRRLVEQARLAARVRVPVLLVGEPGTGKEWLARAIHNHSAARETAFVALDCGSLPPGVLAALTFGEGGLVRRANLGTIYLRDPERLPRDLQDRLAELAGEVGEAGPRVMAGTSADLAEEVRAGRLRDDLYSALGTLVLELPALRARPAADLPWLAERLLRRAAGEETSPPPELTPEAWELVYAHGWPGNLRELGKVLSRARAHAAAGPEPNRIQPADLPAYLRLPPGGEPSAPRPLPLDQLLEQAERRLIRLALRLARGKKYRAAEILGIWKPRLLRRMEALGIADEEKEAKGEAGEDGDE